MSSIAGLAEARDRPTLKSIAVDGDLTDWTEILLNPAQWVSDGDSSSWPCEHSSDRDCPVQSTGRDLRAFAWTWDEDFLYLLVRRQGNTANRQTTWFYFDVSGPAGRPDRLMGSGDLVLRVRHDGATGVTTNALYRYSPADPAGDPMSDAEGHSDGYTLPGGLLEPAAWLEGEPHGGAPSGEVFEERIPWVELGVAPGTPLGWHVASANDPRPDSVPEQVDDNLGAGPAGTFGFRALALEPEHRLSAAPGAVVPLPHEVENLGSWPSRVELAARSSLGHALELREDLDGDGVAESTLALDINGDGDFVDAGDLLLRDEDGDGLPEWPADPAGLAARGGRAGFVLWVRTEAGAEGQDDAIVVEARHADELAPAASVRDLLRLGGFVLDAPGQPRRVTEQGLVRHPVRACNHGPPGVFDLTAESARGWEVRLVRDSDCDGVGEELLAVDRRGDGSWDGAVLGDSDGDGLPDTGPLDEGECACFVIECVPPAREGLGDVDRVILRGASDESGSGDEAELVTEVAPRLELVPDHLFAEGTGLVTGAQRSVWLPHRVRNSWFEPEVVDFAAVAPSNDRGWELEVWSDPDADGNPSDGAPVSLSPPVDAGGGEWPLVLRIRVPADVPPGLVATSRLTGSAASDASVTGEAVDEVLVSSIATYRDAAHLLPARHFAPCDVVHALARDLERDPSGAPAARYDLLWRDPADRVVRHVPAPWPDLGGEAADSLELTASSPSGEWRLTLLDDGSPGAWHAFAVEAQARIEALSLDWPVQPLAGGDLSIGARLVNGNSVASLPPGRLSYVVLDAESERYLVDLPPGRFQSHFEGAETRSVDVPSLLPGEVFEDSFTVADVSYPSEGTHSILARWTASCGAPLVDARTDFAVGAGEDCANGTDDDGDRLADCDDPECALDPACTEQDCGDGLDEDGDGLADCADSDCQRDPRCLPEEVCNDGLDDDLDGAIDCADADCLGDPACPERDCSDGLDDDGDGEVDCEDLDCAPEAACQPENDCRNGEDDDLDGRIDCEDEDCAGSSACPEGDCADGLDDDGDGAVDCADEDCLSLGGDCDGDGVTDPEDCAPGDAGAHSVPGEVRELRVRREAGDRDPTVTLTWASAIPGSGSETLHELLAGRVEDLWADRGFDRIACLDGARDAAVASDGRSLPGVGLVGYYYLVRARNSCGGSGAGAGSAGDGRELPPAACE